MIKEAVGTGLTIEEAKENALLALGDYADVNYDVVEMPKKKALGLFGGAKAQVRAYVELPDEKPAKSEKTAKREKAEKSAKHTAEIKQEAVIPDSENTVPASEIGADTAAGKAIGYLNGILKALGCKDVDIKVALKENGAEFYLSGEGLGAAIGRRGETLDALQYLTSLSANAVGGYYRVTLNIGNYRERREQTLISLAKRMSAQALRSGRNRTLEPMNPYERRIIHTAVQEINGVSSHSVGEGSGRRVVITPDNAGKHGKNVAAQARAQKKDTELPLYGKLN